jgi:hypothetical protein
VGIQMDSLEALPWMTERFGWILTLLTNLLAVLRSQQAG